MSGGTNGNTIATGVQRHSVDASSMPRGLPFAVPRQPEARVNFVEDDDTWDENPLAQINPGYNGASSSHVISPIRLRKVPAAASPKVTTRRRQLSGDGWDGTAGTQDIDYRTPSPTSTPPRLQPPAPRASDCVVLDSESDVTMDKRVRKKKSANDDEPMVVHPPRESRKRHKLVPVPTISLVTPTSSMPTISDYRRKRQLSLESNGSSRPDKSRQGSVGGHMGTSAASSSSTTSRRRRWSKSSSTSSSSTSKQPPPPGHLSNVEVIDIDKILSSSQPSTSNAASAAATMSREASSRAFEPAPKITATTTSSSIVTGPSAAHFASPAATSTPNTTAAVPVPTMATTSTSSQAVQCDQQPEIRSLQEAAAFIEGAPLADPRAAVQSTQPTPVINLHVDKLVIHSSSGANDAEDIAAGAHTVTIEAVATELLKAALASSGMAHPSATPQHPDRLDNDASKSKELKVATSQGTQTAASESQVVDSMPESATGIPLTTPSTNGLAATRMTQEEPVVGNVTGNRAQNIKDSTRDAPTDNAASGGQERPADIPFTTYYGPTKSSDIGIMQETRSAGNSHHSSSQCGDPTLAHDTALRTCPVTECENANANTTTPPSNQGIVVAEDEPHDNNAAVTADDSSDFEPEYICEYRPKPGMPTASVGKVVPKVEGGVGLTASVLPIRPKTRMVPKPEVDGVSNDSEDHGTPPQELIQSSSHRESAELNLSTNIASTSTTTASYPASTSAAPSAIPSTTYATTSVASDSTSTRAVPATTSTTTTSTAITTAPATTITTPNTTIAAAVPSAFTSTDNAITTVPDIPVTIPATDATIAIGAPRAPRYQTRSQTRAQQSLRKRTKTVNKEVEGNEKRKK